MALFNEIQVGRLNRFVQKLLAIKGQPPMPTVSSDLQFVHEIKSGNENRYLEGWNLFGFSGAVTANAGSFSLMELFNPAGSNAVAVVTRASWSSGTAEAPKLQVVLKATGQQANVRVAGNFDSRSNTGSVVKVTDNNAAATVAVNGSGVGQAVIVNLPLNTPYSFIQRPEDEVLLLPGDALYITATITQAIAAGFNFMWRERYLEDAERQ